MSTLALGHILLLIEITLFPYKSECYHLDKDRTFRKDILLNRLLDYELIEFEKTVPPPGTSEPNGFTVTEKGRAYIQAFRNTPMPVLTWVMK